MAYELRDCVYSAPNRSLLSTARGRTREFKDRRGEDVGRSVTAWGLWADILNSPYHCFGTVCEARAGALQRAGLQGLSPGRWGPSAAGRSGALSPFADRRRRASSPPRPRPRTRAGRQRVRDV